MWMMLTTGTAFLMVIYIREYFARYHDVGKLGDSDYAAIVNHPIITQLSSAIHLQPSAFISIYDFFVPRTYRIQYYT